MSSHLLAGARLPVQIVLQRLESDNGSKMYYIHRNGTCEKVMTSTSIYKNVPVSPNEVYKMNKMTSEEIMYEPVM